MENLETQLIPHIKKEAVIPIEVSAGFLQRLQELMMAIPVMQDPLEARKFLEQELHKVKDPASLEGWKAHYITVAILVSTIERKAEELGFVEHKEIPGN